MAPSIISHFRNHRRGGSTPASPQPDSQHASASAPSPNPPSTPFLPTAPSSPLASQTSRPVSSQPPILPPITRVASQKDSATIHDDVQHETPSSATIHRRPTSSQTQPLRSASTFSFVLPPIQRVTSHEQDSPDTPTPISASDDILEAKRKLSEPSAAEHPQRLSARLSKTRASFADYGRTHTAPMLIQQPPESPKPPQTPSNSSRKQSTYDQAFLNPPSRHAASPASSTSSFHKTSSSTNLAVESSPASSRSAQGSSTDKPSAPSHRLSKGRFNLLNPVSLLKRRRTSQVLEGPAESSIHPNRDMRLPAMHLPADYDPRIKGKGVHDFDGGPRPRRNHSANDMPGVAARADNDVHDNSSPRQSSIPMLQAGPNDVDMPPHEKEHAPVFVENFDDEEENEHGVQGGASAVQRESLANSQFLARMSKQLNFDSLDLAAPFAPSRAPPSDTSVTPPATTPVPGPSESVPERQATPTKPSHHAQNSRNTDYSSVRISSDQSTARSSTSNETKATSPSQSPALDHRQSRTLEPPFQPTSDLSHLPSTASRVSRFSFQLNSDRSIEQEKALEEKHKQRHESSTSKRDSRLDEYEEEGFDYDDMLDDAGYEEEIPTMGEDTEIDSMNASLREQRLSSFNNAALQPEIDVTRASSRSHYTTGSFDEQQPEPLHGLGLQGATSLPVQASGLASTDNEAHSLDFGDMYFDDGMIGDATAADGSAPFDESAFDSPTRARFEGETQQDDFTTPKHRAAPAGSQTWSSANREDLSSEHSDSLEKTPTKSAVTRQREAVQQAPAQETGLNAYHNALAEAASRAARDGKFTRQNSVMSASSIYSSNASMTEAGARPHFGERDHDPDEQDYTGTRQAFEDTEDEDDLFVAEANADALNSEDCDFYGQEFGFFRNPNATGDGQLYNGGYFGQPALLGASLRNREPNLTPITERSEYSTRNSVIGGTPWGPPSSGPWGPPSSASQHNLVSPALKDIAASMGMDDEDMTLGQLLRLRKEAFGSAMGSGPQSAHVSSSSNDSSPISQHNPSPLAGRSHSSSNVAGMHNYYEGHFRRPSEPELPQVQEAPENVESGEDSPISENVTLGTARAILYNSRMKQRRTSADMLAQEYSTMLNPNSSPVPIIREPVQPGSPTATSRRSLSAAQADAGSPGPATVESPSTQRAQESQALPSPPTAMMQKFANRPPPDAYRKVGAPSQSRPQHRRQSSGDGAVSGSTSVAYVREVDEHGAEHWFLERRRQKSSGELVVVGREAIEGGKI